jgi:hypothetical protein
MPHSLPFQPLPIRMDDIGMLADSGVHTWREICIGKAVSAPVRATALGDW